MVCGVLSVTIWCCRDWVRDDQMRGNNKRGGGGGERRRVNVVQAPNVSCWLKVLWDLFLYFEYKWKIYLTFWFFFFHLMCVWQKLFLPTYFTIQLIFATIHGPTALFGTIHGFHCTISANFYLYLQYFQQKIFNFSKINGSQTQILFFF